MMKVLGLLAMGLVASCTSVTPPSGSKVEYETFGIRAVPPEHVDMLATCEYLGEIEGKSFWGGAYAKDISVEGTTKRIYKKAHEMKATDLVLQEDIEYAGWGTARSAKAYRCKR